MAGSYVPLPLIGNDKWIQVSSVTASGTTVSFTGITGYRKLAVLFKTLSPSSAGSKTISMTLNSDTATAYRAFKSGTTSIDTSFDLGTMQSGTSPSPSGMIIIDNVDSDTIKMISGSSYNTSGTYNYQNGSHYEGNAKVTSVQIKTSDSFGFAGGTIILYGAA